MDEDMWEIAKRALVKINKLNNMKFEEIQLSLTLLGEDQE